MIKRIAQSPLLFTWFILFGLISTLHAQNKQNQVLLSEKDGAIIYPDIIQQNEKRFIHFKWRPDISNHKKVIVTTKPEISNTVIAEVYYPRNTFEVASDMQIPDTIYFTTINKEGDTSLPIVVNTRMATTASLSKMDRITIEQNDKGAYFAKNGKRFIPKGVNYVGLLLEDHATFEPDHHDGIIQGYYDPMTTESIIKLLKQKGYNLIRVFLKTGDRNPRIWGLSGNPEDYSAELWQPYMNNVVDLIRCARKYGIYVMPTFADNERMANKYWSQDDKFGKASYQEILFSENAIKAKKEYVTKFLNYIVNQPDGIELEKTLFALTMQNEFHFDCNRPPFAPVNGGYNFVYSHLGKDYDMSLAESRRALALAAAHNYYKEMKSAVKNVMPFLPVGEGTFTLAAVGKDVSNSIGIFPISKVEDPRFPLNGVEYLNTEIDFLDFHIYKWGVDGDGYSAFFNATKNMLLDTYEAKELMKKKPVILGEFGSFVQDHPTIDEAEDYVLSLRDAAMQNGFQGWCYWTFDCFEQKELWNLMHNNGQILDALTKDTP